MNPQEFHDQQQQVLRRQRQWEQYAKQRNQQQGA